MLQEEFENGIKVDLSYLPCALKGKWFREVEEYYLANCNSKEDAYKHFRKEIKNRVQALSEWRFTSNLELCACLRLALQRLDKRDGSEGAILRHDWIGYLETIIGSEETFTTYRSTNAWIQALRGVLSEMTCDYRDLELDGMIADLGRKIISALHQEAAFEGRKTGCDINAQESLVAQTIILLIVDQWDPEYTLPICCPSLYSMTRECDDFRWNYRR